MREVLLSGASTGDHVDFMCFISVCLRLRDCDCLCLCAHSCIVLLCGQGFWCLVKSSINLIHFLDIRYSFFCLYI